MLSWVPYCGRCRMCAHGRPNLCEDLAWSDAGTMMDGTVRFQPAAPPVHHYTVSSFSGLSVVPAQSCIPVAGDLPLAELALMGCAVMTGFGAVFNTAGVRPGDRVAVIGCGGVGLNVIQAAAIAGATTDHRRRRRPSPRWTWRVARRDGDGARRRRGGRGGDPPPRRRRGGLRVRGARPARDDRARARRDGARRPDRADRHGGAGRAGRDRPALDHARGARRARLLVRLLPPERRLPRPGRPLPRRPDPARRP